MKKLILALTLLILTLTTSACNTDKAAILFNRDPITEENVLNLKEFAKKIKNVEKIELLGYHTLGVSKYEKLKIPYPLKDVPEMDDQKLEKLQKLLK